MKQTTMARLLGMAALAALMAPSTVAAQEPETEEMPEVTVRLASLGEAVVSGDIVLRMSDERQEMSTDPQPVELTLNVEGLEPNQEVRLLVHQGPCSTGTTTVDELGSYVADEEGAVNETETVTSERLWEALQGPGAEPMTEETTEENEEAEAYHLQIESMGEPLACGNFESEGM